MQSDKKIDILELNHEQLVAWLAERKIEKYRADQIQKWVYLRQADNFEPMTNISKEIRALLSQHFVIGRLAAEQIETSRDGSRKYLFRLKDGKYIESVLIPERDHYTLCVSSQVGCAQNCLFCLTATGGFERNLTRGEIIAQVRDIKNELDDPMRLTNIVFMGMGEPLANYNNLISAIGVITNTDAGLRLASRPMGEGGNEVNLLLPVGIFAAAIGAATLGLVSVPVAFVGAVLMRGFASTISLSDVYESIEDIWPDYPSKDDFFFNEDEY